MSADLDAAGVRRPRTAAVVLAGVAGYVDAFVFLRVAQVFIANQSGNLIVGGMAVGGSDVGDLVLPATSVVAYIAGAALAAALFDRPAHQGRRRLFDTVSGVIVVLLVAGAVTLFRYAPDAWEIVVRGRRAQAAEDGDGSHLAAYGVTLLAAGSCYVGLYGLLWTYIGQPGTWLGTAYSGFGRAIMFAGFGLLFLSPGVTRRGIRLPMKVWVIALIAAALLAAFLLGTRVGDGQLAGLSYRLSMASR